MVTEEQVRESLNGLLVPGIRRSLEGLNLVRGVTVSDYEVKITLASAALSSSAQEWVKTKSKEVIEKLPEVNKVEVEFIEAKPAELNKIGHTFTEMIISLGESLSLVTTAGTDRRRSYDFRLGNHSRTRKSRDEEALLRDSH